MLPKKYRLTFQQFKKNAQRPTAIHTSTLSFFIKKSPLLFTRFVVIVPKLVDKRSTKRHRIKRVIMNNIYNDINEIHKGYDVLIKVKKRQEETNVKQIIKNVLYQGHLIQ